MGITANGYETTAIKEIEKDLQNLFLAALGADLSLDPETPQGQIISILTNLLHQIDEKRQDDFYARDVYHAQGLQLDVIGRELDLPRKDSIPTQILVTIKGALNYTIPAGTLANIVTNPEQVFEFTEDVKITAAEQKATLTAANGAVYENLTAGVQLATQNYMPQIYDITTNSVIYGQAAESDYSYRVRLINAQGANVDEVQRLTIDLQNINNVLSAYVEPNNTLETSETGIPSHAVEIVVLGGGEEDIADVLMKHLFATPTYAAPDLAEIVSGTDYNGHTQNFAITRPAEVDVKIEITYKNKQGQGFSPEMQAEQRAKLAEAVNATYMNKTLYRSDICNIATTNYTQVFAIENLSIKVGGVEMGSAFTCTARQYLHSVGVTFTEQAG